MRPWLPSLAICAAVVLMGVDGGNGGWLPLAYVVANSASSWLGARNGVKRLEVKLDKHLADQDPHDCGESCPRRMKVAGA